MIVLNFDVQKQRIIKKNKEYLANHTKNFLLLSFSFDDLWKNHPKYIIFKYNEKNYLNFLTYNGESGNYEVVVPSIVLKGLMFRFTIYELLYVGGSEERITTQEVTIKLHDSGFTEDISNISNDEDSVDIFTTLFENLSTKFDDLLIEEDNILCKSEGTIVKVIPLSAFLDDYYDKSEMDNLLEGKANNIHDHLVSDVNDFDDAVDLDLSNVLGNIAENIRRI
ncbi:hypothetical protein [Methanobrevibacter sp.]|uniref:hypothetical protein n=1 Tax=Methanobrevibacter sp. TaxID=66852 RepID=UPI0038647637